MVACGVSVGILIGSMISDTIDQNELLHGSRREGIFSSAILLFGQAFWERLIDFDHLVESGMINADDRQLFHYVETAEQAWEHLATHYGFTPDQPGVSLPAKAPVMGT